MVKTPRPRAVDTLFAGPVYGQARTLARLQAALCATVRAPGPQHCQPIPSGGDRLILITDSAVWATRLRLSERALLGTAQAHGLSVRELEVRIRPGSTPRRRTPEPSAGGAPARRPNPALSQGVALQAAASTDDALRAALTRLAARLGGR